MHYRDDIDGLRAFAVFLVVIFHAAPSLLPKGYLGVDVFFVISGFLISSIILGQMRRNSFSFVNFYIRRVKRIFPPALLVLTVANVFALLTLFDSEFSDFKRYSRSAAGFYLNFLLLKDAGYFDIASKFKPLLHFWSLAIEEQFYLVWPLLLFVQYLCISYITKKIETLHRYRDSALLFLNLVLACIGIYFFLNHTNDLYFSSAMRAWELLAGCLCAMLIGLPINQDASNLLAQIKNRNFLVILAGVVFTISLVTSSPKIATLLCVASTMIFLLTKNDLSYKFLFRSKPMIFWGQRSYSLYLWHWPMLSFARIYQPSIDGLTTLSLVLTSMALAHLTYLFIEEPLKRQNWDLQWQRKSHARNLRHIFNVGAYLSLMICLVYFSPKLSKPQDINVNSLVMVEDSQLNLRSHCLLDHALTDKTKVAWCLSSQEGPPKHALLFGDSHAHALFAGITATDTSRQWQLVAHHSCPPFRISSPGTVCEESVEATINYLKSKSDIDLVVFDMANRVFQEHLLYFQDPDLQKKIVQDVKEMANSGKQLVFIQPTPEIAENINNCLKQRRLLSQVVDTTSQCRVSQNTWSSKIKNHTLFLAKLKQEVPQIIIDGDPAQVVCENSWCNTIKNNQSLYYDRDHLSFFGSRLVGQEILKAIDKPATKKIKAVEQPQPDKTHQI